MYDYQFCVTACIVRRIVVNNFKGMIFQRAVLKSFTVLTLFKRMRSKKDRIFLNVLRLLKAQQSYFLVTILETEQKEKHSKKASRHPEEAPRANIPARQSCQGFLATVLLLEIRAVYWIRIKGMNFSLYLEKDIYKISLD